jgi:dipeptidyl aminopeptidase/acylaminoacyl peptidase
MHMAMRGAALALFGLICAPVRADGPAPPVSAFGGFAQVRFATLSPNGTLLAWVDASTTGEDRINVYDIVANKDVRVFGLDASFSISRLLWNDNDTLLYELTQTQKLPAYTGRNTGPDIQREIHRLFAIGLADKNGRMMMGQDSDLVWSTRLVLLRSRTSKPHTIIVWMYTVATQSARMITGSHIDPGRLASPMVPTVFEVDTSSGKGHQMELGDQFTADWLVDSGGQVVARTEWDPTDRMFEILAKRGPNWTSLYRSQRDTPMSIEGLTADQSAVLIIDQDADGRAKVWTVPLDGSSRSVKLEQPAGDVTDVQYDAITGAPISFSATGPEPRQMWIDKDAEARYQILARSFPHLNVRVEAESGDYNIVVARVDGPSNPPIHYLINRATHRAQIVGADYPELKGVKLGEVTSLSYKARDGTDIPAYLTLPSGAGDGPMPLVVLPHGTPGDRDSGSEYESLRQFLATRGYAVFQPQFRGSSGLGDAFERAGDRQWGLLMQDDLTDGVHALIDMSRVDPRRICILGYSYASGYAGYAALAGAAFTPSLYKCAIGVNGVSDLPKFIGFQNERQGKDSNNEAYWRQHLGERSDANVVAKSPARAADGITASVLLIYSTNDSVVPPTQSMQMADGLKKAGKGVQLVELAGADHWLSRPTMELHALEVIDKFLHDHL